MKGSIITVILEITKQQIRVLKGDILKKTLKLIFNFVDCVGGCNKMFHFICKCVSFWIWDLDLGLGFGFVIDNILLSNFFVCINILFWK